MQSVKTSQGMAIDTAECSHTFRLPEVKLIHILEASEEKGSADEVKVSGGFLLGGEGRCRRRRGGCGFGSLGLGGWGWGGILELMYIKHF